MAQLVNNGLIREERLGRMLSGRVGSTYEDARRAYAEDLAKWDVKIDRIAD